MGDSLRRVLKSSKQSCPHGVRWYNRVQQPEDPWISTEHHREIDNGRDDQVYGEASTVFLLETISARGGGNVFIRDAQLQNSVSGCPSAYFASESDCTSCDTTTNPTPNPTQSPTKNPTTNPTQSSPTQNPTTIFPSVTPSSPPSSAPSCPAATATAQDDDEGNVSKIFSNTGVLVGVIVAVLAVLACGFALGIFVARKRNGAGQDGAGLDKPRATENVMYEAPDDGGYLAVDAAK